MKHGRSEIIPLPWVSKQSGSLNLKYAAGPRSDFHGLGGDKKLGSKGDDTGESVDAISDVIDLEESACPAATGDARTC